MIVNKKQTEKDRAAEEKRQWVRLTNACNQRCLFCHDRERHDGSAVPLARVVKELKAGRSRGCSRAVLSGGEPTLHPRLLRVIKTAKQLGYTHVQLITNGRMLYYGDLVKQLKAAGLDEVTLSLHSHRQGPFERITGVKGSYRQAMRGLLNALQNKLIVSVDIVINKANYRTLADTLRFFLALGVHEFDLLHLVPFGDAWKNRKDVYFSLDTAAPYLKKAFALSRRAGIYLWTNRLPATYLEGHEELIQHPRKLEDEVRGMERDLRRFLRTGEGLWCLGERCRQCFLGDFCRDLVELRRQKVLAARRPPACLRKGGGPSLVYRFKKNMDVDQFLDFFIRHRYFVKSLRCRGCALDKDCHGAQIDEIRARGFKILRPLSKG